MDIELLSGDKANWREGRKITVARGYCVKQEMMYWLNDIMERIQKMLKRVSN